jgi:hypothetical protein
VNKNKVVAIILSVCLISVVAFSSVSYLSMQSEITGLKNHNVDLVNQLSDLEESRLKVLGSLAELSWVVIPFDDSWTFVKTVQASDVNLYVDQYTNGTNYGAILRFPSLNITSPMYLGDKM